MTNPELKHPDDTRLLAGTVPPEGIAERGHAVTKSSWRVALEQVAMPALRLHRYRNTRTRMLYDALCDVDCGQ